LGAYVEQVYAWATAEARCERFRIFHAEKGFLDADGAVRGGQYPALYEQQAQRYREALGLTPLSDAQLAKTRAEAVLSVADLDSIRQRGRDIYAKRQVEIEAGTSSSASPAVEVPE
jgi:hypothetical protein